MERDKEQDSNVQQDDEQQQDDQQLEDSQDEESQDDQQQPVDDDETSKTFDYAYVKKLRDEAASYRTAKNKLQQDLATVNERIKALEREKMTDQERVQDELRELKEQTVPMLQRSKRELEVQLVAQKIGNVDPEAATVLVDWQQVEAEDANLEEILQELVEKKPWLKQAEEPTKPKEKTTPANPASNNNSGPKTFTRAQIAKMTQEELEANMDDIKKAMAEGRIKQG